MEVTIVDGGAQGESISLVSFSNGRVDCSSSGAKTRHSLYQEKGRKRRTLVTKTDHVTYTGSNYETEATMSDLPFRKYMVGVLDKEKGIMELHKADIFHMTPYIKGRSDVVVSEVNPSERKTLSREDYSKGLEKTMMSFGSSRAKKVWSAAKRNYIDSERLEETLAPAVTHAETETDRDGIDGLEASVQASPYLPKCNTDASTPDEVYQLNDLISSQEMVLLKSTAKSLIEGKETSDYLKEEERSQFFVTNFPAASSNGVKPVELVSMLLYCDYLITLYKSPPKKIQRFGLQRCEGIPHFMHSSLLDKFTEGGGGGARGGAKGSQHSFTQKMKDKVMSYLFAIALRVSGYSLNSTTLQRDLQISSNKVVSMFRVLGCSAAADKTAASDVKQYNITLKIPPVFTTASRNKRRKLY